MILCLDFDGVLHSYSSGWRGARNIPDPPVPGAMAFLLEAVESFEVAVFSSRSRYPFGRRAMKRWLARHLSEHEWNVRGARHYGGYTGEDVQDAIDDVVVTIISRISFPRWKPAAFVTLDDRAITFTGEWPNIEELKRFEPWTRRRAMASMLEKS